MRTTPKGCSCGKVESHVIMERTTLDGFVAYLYSDGDLVDRMGNGRRKAPSKLVMRIKLMNEACILNWDELMTEAK